MPLPARTREQRRAPAICVQVVLRPDRAKLERVLPRTHPRPHFSASQLVKTAPRCARIRSREVARPRPALSCVGVAADASTCAGRLSQQAGMRSDALVIAYHGVSHVPRSPLEVRVGQLERHVRALIWRGYRFETVTRAVEATGSGERVAAISFDDGDPSVVELALPL